jgi:hypothetical protein
MTSEEILRRVDMYTESANHYVAGPLWEIAYQLAVMNERGKAMWTSFPVPSKPTVNDVNDVKWLTDLLRARDLARKTDREQNG